MTVESSENSNPAHTLFAAEVARRRRIGRIVFGAIVLLTAGVAWWKVSNAPNAEVARLVGMEGMVAIMFFVAFLSTFVKPRGLEVLKSPEQIVWFYGMGRAGRVMTAIIGTEAGKLHRLPVLKPAEAMAALRSVLPHATEGHSEAVRQRFVKDPASLRKAQ